jgi:alpha-methylacyl-CoA racemase
LNPKVILCAISGYGADGPYKDKAGHDLNYISLGGIQDVTGTRGGKAVMPGFQLADIAGGSLMATIGILAAVNMRSATGKGQFVDVSMMEGAMLFLTPILATFFAQGNKPQKGREHLTGGLVCYNIYEAKDGFFSCGALEPKFWQEFARLVGREDLIDEQMVDGEKYDKVYEEVNAIFKTRTRKEWTEFFKDKDVCCEPVNEVTELLDDPHIKERGCFFEMEHPTEGRFKAMRVPLRFSDAREQRKEPPPGFGEHTRESIKALEEKKII